jgi:hypothetical protein
LKNLAIAATTTKKRIIPTMNSVENRKSFMATYGIAVSIIKLQDSLEYTFIRYKNTVGFIRVL